MATKTITITKSAYDALAREKRKNESFSQLALRLTGERGSLRECCGLWKFTDKDREIFQQIKLSWDQCDKELVKRMGK